MTGEVVETPVSRRVPCGAVETVGRDDVTGWGTPSEVMSSVRESIESLKPRKEDRGLTLFYVRSGLS